VKQKRGLNKPGHVYEWERYWRRGSLRHRLNLPSWLCWEWPWQRARRIRRHERERVNHGFSWYDWISFDTYICLVIADAVADFRLKGAGYPMGMEEQEWHDLLHKIEDPLRWWAEQKFDNELDAKGELQKYKEAQAAMALFAEHLGSMWD
jgi:hypothetical protein